MLPVMYHTCMCDAFEKMASPSQYDLIIYLIVQFCKTLTWQSSHKLFILEVQDMS